MTRWDVGAAIALVAVGVLAVVLLWRRMVGDRPGSLAAAGAIVVAVGAAIWSYVVVCRIQGLSAWVSRNG